jgi:hypothetical protein
MKTSNDVTSIQPEVDSSGVPRPSDVQGGCEAFVEIGALS